MGYRIVRQVSSGGVIVRRAGHQLEACLITRRHEGQLVWGLPKGHLEAGEAPEEAAIREVREETGLQGTLRTKVGTISYWFVVKEERVRCFKMVHFYLLDYQDGKTQAHDSEVEDAVWLPLDEAVKRLSYKNERRVLLKAKRYLASGKVAKSQSG